MKNIKQRIEFLENIGQKGARPIPIPYFYGESLPADFYTNPIYLKSKLPSIEEFYTD